MNPIIFISNAAAKTNPVAAILPHAAVSGVTMLHNVNSFWRTRESYSQIRSDSNKATQYYTGAFGSFVLKGTPLAYPLKALSRIVLVGVTIFESIERYNAFSKAYLQLSRSFRTRHIVVVDVSRGLSARWYSPYNIAYYFDPAAADHLRVKCHLAYIRIYKIGQYSIGLFTASLNLSSSLIMLSEAHKLDGLEGQHAENSIFVNMRKIFEETSNNSEKLIDMLEQNSSGINLYLEGIQAGYKTEHLIASVKKLSTSSTAAGTVVDEMTSTVRITGKKVFQGWRAIWSGISPAPQVEFEMKEMSVDIANSLPFSKERNISEIMKVEEVAALYQKV